MGIIFKKHKNYQILCKYVFCLTFCFIQTSLFSQSNKLHFSSLTSKDGLSSNIVRAILKDRYGLLWFATEDGLNKFDGNSFTTTGLTKKINQLYNLTR